MRRGASLPAYFLIGGLGAALYVAIGVGLVEFTGMSAGLASLLAYALLVPGLYLLQRAYTFRPRTVADRMFWRYAIVQAAALTASSVLVAVLVSELQVPPLAAFASAALGIGIVSYLVHQAWTFATL